MDDVRRAIEGNYNCKINDDSNGNRNGDCNGNCNLDAAEKS